MSANAADLDDISFNMESVDEMVGDIEENELICENVDNGVNVSHPVDEEKKKEFERNRDDILSRVPNKVKARFGEIFFSSFGKFTGPVLVLNPYSVAPGLLRENWFTMFNNCQESGRAEKMTHMAYWYGCSNDLPNAYSFPKTSQLMSYDIGFKKIEKKLISLKQRLDEGKKLSSKEVNLLNGMDEVEIDRKKNSGERSGVVGFDFLDEYHVLVEEQEQNEPQKKQNPIKDKPGKSKKKKMKKKKKMTQPDTQIMMTKIETQEIIENGKRLKTKKLIQKRTKKDKNSTDSSRPKKKVKISEVSNQCIKPVVKPTMANLKDNDIRHKESEHGTATVEDARPSAYEEFAGLGEVSSHGETDDENLLINDLESEDDSADEDYTKYTESRSKPKATKKKKQKRDANSVTSKKQAKKKIGKIKIDTENFKGEKKSMNNTISNNRIKKEQDRFRSCENKFLHLVRRWEIAIGNKDTNQLSRIYEKLLENMEHFTAPFIEGYGMSDMMKKSKKLVEDKDKWKQVMAKFKKVYTEKKNAVPEGFKAIKESEIKASNDEKIEPTIEVSKRIKTMALQLESEGENQNSNRIFNQVVKIENKLDIQDTPMKTIPKSIKKSRVCVSGGDTKNPLKFEPSSQKNYLSTGKTEKKKRFSLTKLMRPVSSPRPGFGGEDLSSSSVGESSTLPSQSSKQNLTIPSWTSQAISTGTPPNENRLFGLEFLQQGIPCVPENKNVNHNAIAHNLELAIYKWSTGDFNERNTHHGIGKIKNHKNESEVSWVDKYWSKIHDLVACISGKRLKGTIAEMIAAGKFASPEKLICLSDDALWCSFLGSPLPGF